MEWPVFQTTAKDYSLMLVEAGQHAVMSCSDMRSA